MSLGSEDTRRACVCVVCPYIMTLHILRSSHTDGGCPSLIFFFLEKPCAFFHSQLTHLKPCKTLLGDSRHTQAHSKMNGHHHDSSYWTALCLLLGVLYISPDPKLGRTKLLFHLSFLSSNTVRSTEWTQLPAPASLDTPLQRHSYRMSAVSTMSPTPVSLTSVLPITIHLTSRSTHVQRARPLAVSLAPPPSLPSRWLSTLASSS